MGGALLSVVRKQTASVAVFDTDEEKARATEAAYFDAATLAGCCRFVTVGVKPNVVERVAETVRGSLTAETVLISMAAGVTVERLKTLFGTDRVIRIMPNTPAAVGAGLILYAADPAVPETDLAAFRTLFQGAGALDAIDERLMDAGMAVSGCGPAYAYMVCEAMADGAVKCGLPRDKATLCAAQTLLGAAKMLLESGKHPGALKDAVCSPGGTTIEGVLALEHAGFRAAVADAVVKAYEKLR